METYVLYLPAPGTLQLKLCSAIWERQEHSNLVRMFKGMELPTTTPVMLYQTPLSLLGILKEHIVKTIHLMKFFSA